MNKKYHYKGRVNKSIKIVCPVHDLTTTVDLYDYQKKILGVGCRLCFEKLRAIEESFKKLEI